MQITTGTVKITLDTQAERDALKDGLNFAKSNLGANLSSLQNAMFAAIITALENAPQDD
jgi:hypothetical protein